MSSKKQARLTRRQFTHAGAAAFGLAILTPGIAWAEDKDAELIRCALSGEATGRRLLLRLTMTNTTSMSAGIRHMRRDPIIWTPSATLVVGGQHMELKPNALVSRDEMRRRPIPRVAPRPIMYELPSRVPREVARFFYRWPEALKEAPMRFKNQRAEISLTFQTDVLFRSQEKGARAHSVRKTLTMNPEAVSMRLPLINPKA